MLSLNILMKFLKVNNTIILRINRQMIFYIDRQSIVFLLNKVNIKKEHQGRHLQERIASSHMATNINRSKAIKMIFKS